MTCSEPRKCMWLAHIFIFEHLRLAKIFFYKQHSFFLAHSDTVCLMHALLLARKCEEKAHKSLYETYARTYVTMLQAV